MALCGYMFGIWDDIIVQFSIEHRVVKEYVSSAISKQGKKSLKTRPLSGPICFLFFKGDTYFSPVPTLQFTSKMREKERVNGIHKAVSETWKSYKPLNK